MKCVLWTGVLFIGLMAGTGYSGEAVVWVDRDVKGWPGCVREVRHIPETAMCRVWFADGRDCLQQLRETPGVLYVEAVKPVDIEEGVTDPAHLDDTCNELRDKAVLSQLGQGEDTVVAVVDTGIALSVFGDRLAVNTGEVPGDGIDNDRNGYVDDYLGWNVGDMTADIGDLAGHGTQVSSVVLSVAPESRIVPVKVGSGSQTSFTTGDAAEAIYYAVSRGVDVINLSFSTADFSFAIFSALSDADAVGILVTAAAGNDGRVVQFPASMETVVAVGSHDIHGAPSWFSPVGDELDLLGPGEDACVMDRDGRVVRVSGTSFSTPVAAGVGAVLRSMNPGLTPASVKKILFQGSRDILAPGVDQVSGYGILTSQLVFDAAVPTILVPEQIARGSLLEIGLTLPPTDVFTRVYLALLFNQTILWMDAAGVWFDLENFFFLPFVTQTFQGFETIALYGDNAGFDAIDTTPHALGKYLWAAAIFDRNGKLLAPVTFRSMTLMP